MTWQLDMGDSYNELVQLAAQDSSSGFAARAQLAEAPSLTGYEAFVWDAFFMLSSERASGFGTGSVPFTAMLEYASFAEMSRQETEQFVNVIRALDVHFVAERARRDEKASRDK
ncbi:MAG: hypothetical protein E7773_10225 [Sphingomonas sp.]|uniref:phage tail assembly chaperone n=1 Tax=Sphingomonas sp. TaxID=28214 RepID=UPI0012182E5F|nr:hypothetical protein [Sphingomonas sp.]THD35714.1 MAG: hypothetical protein E7773_10225 [Sphingomonas sp.]